MLFRSRDEALERLDVMRQSSRIPAFELWTEHLQAWLERRREAMLAGMPVLGALKIQDDPEAIFQEGWLLCDVGEYELGLGHLQRAVSKNYFVVGTLARSRQFDALRATPAFQTLLAKAEAGRSRVLAEFREAGGERLLGT